MKAVSEAAVDMSALMDTEEEISLRELSYPSASSLAATPQRSPSTSVNFGLRRRSARGAARSRRGSYGIESNHGVVFELNKKNYELFFIFSSLAHVIFALASGSYVYHCGRTVDQSNATTNYTDLINALATDPNFTSFEVSYGSVLIDRY